MPTRAIGGFTVHVPGIVNQRITRDIRVEQLTGFSNLPTQLPFQMKQLGLKAVHIANCGLDHLLNEFLKIVVLQDLAKRELLLLRNKVTTNIVNFKNKVGDKRFSIGVAQQEGGVCNLMAIFLESVGKSRSPIVCVPTFILLLEYIENLTMRESEEGYQGIQLADEPLGQPAERIW